MRLRIEAVGAGIRILLGVVVAGSGPSLAAQSHAAEEYYLHLPSRPKIVAQTEATDSFDLYGDSLARFDSTSPVPGVDSARAERLLALAGRFSPILHRNNFSVPRNFEDILAFAYDTRSEERRVGKECRL